MSFIIVMTHRMQKKNKYKNKKKTVVLELYLALTPSCVVHLDHY